MTSDLDAFGTEEPGPEGRTLRAGPLSVLLEAGQLRDLRWHGVEALRGIAWLLRDDSWGTAPLVLSDLRVEEGPDAFRATWRLLHDGPAGGVAGSATVEGRADGRLRFAVEARVVRDVVTNRMGFVVLHPDTAAGGALRVGHPDGSVEATSFPRRVSPDQPAFDILSLEHAPAPGVTARIAFEGGVWEMEDQRNWQDASFKTYVRPLALPRPYRVAAGEVDRQAVVLTLSGQPADGPRDSPSSPIRGVVPRLWLRLAEGHPIPSAVPLPRLAHGLIARLRVAGARPPVEAAALARSQGWALAIEAVFPQRDPSAEARACVAALANLPVALLLVCGERDFRTRPSGRDPDGEAPLAATLAALREAGWTGPLGAGTPAFFTELNRNPPPASDLAFFGGCATVHAADDRSVMETVGVLPAILESAEALLPGTPVLPGPLSIAPTVTPYGAGFTPTDGATRTPMAERDPRHGALFGAAHLVATLAALAGRVAEAAPCLLNGPSGLLDDAGRPRPLATVHAEVARAAGRPLRAAPTTRGLAALAWAADGGTVTLAASLGPSQASLPIRPGDEVSRLAPADGGWRPLLPPDGTLMPFDSIRLRAP